MQYAPKLKVAMTEIKAILLKHDIAGVVILHTPGFSEYLNHITPSYSCATLEDSKFMIKAKKEHFKTEEERLEKLRNTANMMHHLSENNARIAMNMIEASEVTDRFLDADHFGGEGHTSHTQQNN